MREELKAGVEYIKTLANKGNKLNTMRIEVFGAILAQILCQKFQGHWYPENPIKGQAYRCIRINRRDREESILEACSYSGLKYQDLTLPKELTLWIDPYEVSCRLGEEGIPYTVATFDPRTARVSDNSRPSDPQENKFPGSTPEDGSCKRGDSRSSPISSGSDSGIETHSEGTSTPVMFQIVGHRSCVPDLVSFMVSIMENSPSLSQS
ncbi:protein BTG4-like [Leptodactylus fuscus]|uniref:protein BTG4-like n=1 Tax=Leptodactylus fuscus TaxID=238119 RepID=UPI003F4E9FA6